MLSLFWVSALKFVGAIQPFQKLGYAVRCIEWRSCLEHNAYHFSIGIEGSYVITQSLVFTT